jgi:hypothetical protein
VSYNSKVGELKPVLLDRVKYWVCLGRGRHHKLRSHCHLLAVARPAGHQPSFKNGAEDAPKNLSIHLLAGRIMRD